MGNKAESIMNEIMDFGDRAKVMLLGTFHFDAPGLDALNLNVDMMTEQRQAEIEEVVRLLEAFQPTKIAVERQLDFDDTLNERFKAYQTGNFELPASEAYQLGFRLAVRLGHDRLYATDVWDRHYESEEQFMERARQRGFTEDNVRDMMIDPKWWNRFVKLWEYTEQLISTKSLREYLAFTNTEAHDRMTHGLYLATPAGEPGDYTAVDRNTGWHNRNLRIFANLKRITESPQDRILVIYGSGHVPLLRHCVENSYEHELVEAGDYL